MSHTSKKETKISRRGILPLLGSLALLPYLGFSKDTDTKETTSTDEEFKTLLKSDGTTVKVKVTALKKSKVLKKNVSNKSLLSWLGRKL